MSIDQDWTRQRNPNKGSLGAALHYLRFVINADSTLPHEREDLNEAFYIILEVQKEWQMNNKASKNQYKKYKLATKYPLPSFITGAKVNEEAK